MKSQKNRIEYNNTPDDDKLYSSKKSYRDLVMEKEDTTSEVEYSSSKKKSYSFGELIELLKKNKNVENR